jgi:predicted DNA-binding transcriptional regulator AlpA
MTTKHATLPPTESSEPDAIVLINAGQFAKMLGVSSRTLWRLLSGGKLIQPVRIGGSTRWRMNDVRRWIDEGCPASGPEPRI